MFFMPRFMKNILFCDFIFSVSRLVSPFWRPFFDHFWTPPFPRKSTIFSHFWCEKKWETVRKWENNEKIGENPRNFEEFGENLMIQNASNLTKITIEVAVKSSRGFTSWNKLSMAYHRQSGNFVLRLEWACNRGVFRFCEESVVSPYRPVQTPPFRAAVPSQKIHSRRAVGRVIEEFGPLYGFWSVIR